MNNEYLTGEEIMASDERSVVELAKFTYPPLGKALEKPTKMIERQRKAIEERQMKAIEDHEKQLVESIKLIKMDFNLGRVSIPLEEPKENIQ